MDPVKLKLILTIITIITNHGLPAFMVFVQNLSDIEKITVEEIESLMGDLDAADYFPGLNK